MSSSINNRLLEESASSNMLRLAVLLLVAVCVHGSAIPELVPRLRLFGDERIVGGSPIKIADAPYQVTFRRHSFHMCGGSIITEYHVLTAAHCSVVDSNPKNLFIGSGSDDLKAVTIHNVVKNTHHDSYNADAIDFDVAILKVETPFVFGTTTKPIGLVTAEPADNEEVVVTGWGALSSGGSSTNQLNAVEVQIVNRKNCSQDYAGFNKITVRMICAGQDLGGKDSCQGDSGGPMVSKVSNKQVGIVSWGYGCARPHYPGVYTNVANEAIQEFVKQQVQN